MEDFVDHDPGEEEVNKTEESEGCCEPQVGDEFVSSASTLFFKEFAELVMAVNETILDRDILCRVTTDEDETDPSSTKQYLCHDKIICDIKVLVYFKITQSNLHVRPQIRSTKIFLACTADETF